MTDCKRAKTNHFIAEIAENAEGKLAISLRLIASKLSGFLCDLGVLGGERVFSDTQLYISKLFFPLARILATTFSRGTKVIGNLPASDFLQLRETLNSS